MARGISSTATGPRPIGIAALVAGTAAAAAALTGLWASRYDWGAPVDVMHALAFGAVLAVSAVLVLNIRFRDETMSLSLFDAVLLPAIVVFPGPVVVLLTVFAHLFAEAWQRIRPLKASFNVAQWALAAITGSFAYRIAAGTAAPGLRSFLALAAALTAMAAVNTILFTSVVSIAQRTSPRRIAATHAPANLLGWLLNGLFGALFFAAHTAQAATIALFVVPLVALHVGLRGYAGAVADRRRLAGLHRASQALSTPINPLDGIDPFLDEVRTCFTASRAELMVAFADGPRTYRSGVATEDGGRRDIMSAVVSVNETTTGILRVFDRVRIGDGDGDRDVLEAMARAVAQAIQKAILLDGILNERRTLADIVAHTSDGICTITESGVVESWNPAFEAITGLPSAIMIGRVSTPAMRPRREDGTDVALERWAAGANALCPILRITATDGRDRTIACSYTTVPAHDGREATLIVVGRDRTAAREVERMREDFVAAVSHELRTPLTPIKGFAETLLQHGETLDVAARAEIARTIGRQADRLERLITNLLEMTKVEGGGRSRPETVVDVAAVAERVVAEFRSAGDRCPLIVTTAPAVAQGETLWVEQVLTNLLSNALKYTLAGSPVHIDVASDDTIVTVKVTDSGPGIPAADRERVFDRFIRLDDDRTRSTGGAGIGLYLSRRLARMMDGDLIVADTPSGTRMVLRLRSARHLAAAG